MNNPLEMLASMIKTAEDEGTAERATTAEGLLTIEQNGGVVFYHWRKDRDTAEREITASHALEILASMIEGGR